MLGCFNNKFLFLGLQDPSIKKFWLKNQPICNKSARIQLISKTLPAWLGSARENPARIHHYCLGSPFPFLHCWHQFFSGVRDPVDVSSLELTIIWWLRRGSCRFARPHILPRNGGALRRAALQPPPSSQHSWEALYGMWARLDEHRTVLFYQDFLRRGSSDDLVVIGYVCAFTNDCYYSSLTCYK